MQGQSQPQRSVFTSFLSWPLVGLLWMSVSACQTEAGPERDISGKMLYERHCSRCHGVDGTPPAAAGAPGFSDANRMAQLSDEQIAGIIRMGRPPRMPGFGDQFLEPSRKVLIAYMRSLSEVKTKTPSP